MTLMFGPVYVIYDYVRYEGCGPPFKAYSTEAAAEAYCKRKNEKLDKDPNNDRHYNWTRLEIME